MTKPKLKRQLITKARKKRHIFKKKEIAVERRAERQRRDVEIPK
jgi:uncharacterized membrane protein YgaE (UPF0421/DUF939 family)